MSSILSNFYSKKPRQCRRKPTRCYTITANFRMPRGEGKRHPPRRLEIGHRGVHKNRILMLGRRRPAGPRFRAPGEIKSPRAFISGARPLASRLGFELRGASRRGRNASFRPLRTIPRGKQMDDPAGVAVVRDQRRQLICNAEPSLRSGGERRAIRLPVKDSAYLSCASARSAKAKDISSDIGVGAR